MSQIANTGQLRNGAKSRQWSWILYDWANSAFATTVLAGFFPLFFKSYWMSEASSQSSTALLGLANSVASGVILLTAPILGVLADQGRRKGRRRRGFLAAFACLGAISTSSLFAIPQDAGLWALGLFAVGSLAFFAGNIFYDSLLLEVAKPEEYDRVSGLGYAFGYLGGALLFSLQVIAFLNPDLFGLKDGPEAVRWAFLSVGAWWAVFALPLLLSRSPEASEKTSPLNATLKATFSEVRGTASLIWSEKPVRYFLLAFLLYNDAVNTVIKMAVDYGLALGFAAQDLITALLITNFVGFPAAILYGWLGEKFGALRGIQVAIGAYLLASVWGSLMTSSTEFYALAAVIGLFQGGIQALSRSHFARLVPADKASEYFGFFNLLGKFSALLGPALIGALALLSGSHRVSMVVIGTFLLGGLLLLRAHIKVSPGNPGPSRNSG